MLVFQKECKSLGNNAKNGHFCGSAVTPSSSVKEFYFSKLNFVKCNVLKNFSFMSIPRSAKILVET